MTRATLWRLLPEPIREVPADLAAIAVWTVVTAIVVFVPPIDETPIRAAIGVAFLLVVPGYALVAALFPDDRAIDGLERAALAIGTSIAVVALVGLALSVTPWGLRTVPIVVAHGGLTLGLTAIAVQRRRDCAPNDRFRVPYRAWIADARAELFHPDSRADAALNVLLIASIILATASVGWAVFVPHQGEGFTEFYLLTETDDGDLVADDYPTEMTSGEAATLIVGIGNHEHERASYGVVGQLQEVRIENRTVTDRPNATGAGTPTTAPTVIVEDRDELARFETTVGDNETAHRAVSVTPRTTGTELRLQWLLYRDGIPEEPTDATAYRTLHLWVNVSAASGAGPVSATSGA